MRLNLTSDIYASRPMSFPHPHRGEHMDVDAPLIVSGDSGHVRDGYGSSILAGFYLKAVSFRDWPDFCRVHVGLGDLLVVLVVQGDVVHVDDDVGSSELAGFFLGTCQSASEFRSSSAAAAATRSLTLLVLWSLLTDFGSKKCSGILRMSRIRWHSSIAGNTFNYKC